MCTLPKSTLAASTGRLRFLTKMASAREATWITVDGPSPKGLTTVSLSALLPMEWLDEAEQISPVVQGIYKSSASRSGKVRSCWSQPSILLFNEDPQGHYGKLPSLLTHEILEIACLLSHKIFHLCLRVKCKLACMFHPNIKCKPFLVRSGVPRRFALQMLSLSNSRLACFG